MKFSTILLASVATAAAAPAVLGNVQAAEDIDSALAGKPAHVTLHVDPQAQAGGDGSTESPFNSPEAAQSKIREMHRRDLYPTQGVTIELAGGYYYREESWELAQEDSGLWNAPVVYRAKPGESVIFHGGRSFDLSQFHPVSDPDILKRLPESSRGSVVELDLSAEGITDYGELPLFGHSMFALQQVTQWRSGGQAPELFYNGQPMTLARWPNEGFAYVGPIIERGDIIRDWMDDRKGQDRYVPSEERNDPPVGFAFQFEDSERLKRWREESDLRLLGYWFNNFSDQAVEVAEVDPDAGVIRSVQPSTYSIKRNQRFFAYNALSELDVPGEWYLDREHGMLYIYPVEPSKNARIDLSLMESPLLKLNQTSFVKFEGITFLGTRTDGVIVSGGEGVTLDGCRVINVGGDGVNLSGRHHRFVNGEIRGTGSSGITLSGGDSELLVPSGNEVFNSHIHNFARIRKTYQPGVRLSGVGNRVAHCEINAAPHVAILIGGNENLVELNYIHDVCRETDDMAAIYAGRSWFRRGNVIRHNLLHDITGYSDGTHRVSGIYMDDGISGTSVLGNVFINLAQGILFNGGRDNRAEGNLFIDVDLMMRATDMTRAFQTWAASSRYTLEKNLKSSPYLTPLWKARYPNLARILEDEPEKPKYSVIKNNLRYNAPMVIGRTGIHESFIDVSWVAHNPGIEQRPGVFNPETQRFVPDPNSGLFEVLPELRFIPFEYIGRF